MQLGSSDIAGVGDIPEVSRDELERRMYDSSLLLVDVLPHESYAAEHIFGAINIPLAELEQRAPQLLPDHNAEITLYCAKFT